MNTRFSFKDEPKWILLFALASALLGLAAVFLVGLFR
jgi:hypothetical protein